MSCNDGQCLINGGCEKGVTAAKPGCALCTQGYGDIDGRRAAEQRKLRGTVSVPAAAGDPLVDGTATMTLLRPCRWTFCSSIRLSFRLNGVAPADVTWTYAVQPLYHDAAGDLVPLGAPVPVGELDNSLADLYCGDQTLAQAVCVLIPPPAEGCLAICFGDSAHARLLLQFVNGGAAAVTVDLVAVTVGCEGDGPDVGTLGEPT